MRATITSYIESNFSPQAEISAFEEGVLRLREHKFSIFAIENDLDLNHSAYKIISVISDDLTATR